MEVFLLLMVGGLSGYLLALLFSWLALVWWGPVLAVGSAAILHKHGFDWPSGIAVIFGCLSLNQVGFLVGAHFRNKLPIQHASDVGTKSPKSINGTKSR
jgi:hypothetical protein